MSVAFPKLTVAISAMQAASAAGSGVFAALGAGATALFGALAPLVGIIAAVGAAFLVWKAYDNYMQKQVQAAQEAGNAWKETNNALSDYKDRVVELRAQLASGTLSEQEAYQAKSELLSIQQSLTDSYGSQADGIDLVNGSLREQIGLMEQLSQSDANKYLNENQKGIDKATKEMEKKRTYYLGQYYDTGDEASEALKKAIKASQEKYGDLITSREGASGEMLLYFDGDASQAEAALNDFMTDVRNASEELDGNYMLDDIFSYSESSLKDANKILDKYQEVYEQAKAAEIAGDKNQYKGTNGVSQTAAKWLNDYSKAVENYNDALASGDTSKIAEAKTNFDAVDKSIKSLLDSDMSGYADSFSEISNQLDTAAINAQKFKNEINGISSGSDDSKLDKKLKKYSYAYENLLNEQQKVVDWGLSDFGNVFDTSGKSFSQTVFGNVDMDKRAIITWSDELKNTYKNALSSWDYDPEIGGIDTVFGGSDRFGEDVLKNGVEVAFTPIMNVDGKATFLDKNTVYDYIESLVGEATTDGVFSENKLLNLDKQGKQIGDTFVHGLVAAADDGLDYDNNGNWAETVGRLMHFSGECGAVALAYNDVAEAAKEAGMSTDEFISAFQGADGSVNSIKKAADALKDLDLDDKDFIYAFETDGVQEGEEQINTLVQAALDAGVISDTSSTSIQKLANMLVELGIISGEPVEGLESTTNAVENLKSALSDLQDTQKKVQTALSNSKSATGLTADDIDNLTAAYKDLDGYNPYKLFEETANGVHLNADELEKLNNQLNANKIQEFSDQISKLRDQIYEKRAKGEDTSELESQLASAKLLKSELEGATSAYNKLISAMNGSKERDSYESLGSAYESMKNTLDQGWYGDESLNAYLDLLLSAQQRTGDAAADFEKLGKTIEGTSHSILDYWKYDDDNNLVTDGLYDFLDDVNRKMGDSFAKMNEDGTYQFDFNGDKLKQVADAFGMSTEAVELFERAMIDAGMAVDMTDLDFSGEVEKAVEALKDLQEAGKISDSINLDFDVDTAPVEDLQSYIDQLKNERVNIDAETNPEAAAALDELIAKCEQTYYAKINAETDGSLDTAIAIVEQLRALTAAPLSVEARAANTDQIANLATQLASLPESVQIAVGIKAENIGDVNAIVNQLNTQPSSIQVPVNYQKGTEPEKVDDATGTANFNLGTSPTTVPDATGTANYTLGSYPTFLPPLRQTIIANKVGFADGTAHADGTVMSMWNHYRDSIGAYAAGNNWSLMKDESALVNELGTESIVRNGRWFPIPGGAQIAQLKKGDIIFSAEQTKELIKSGRITSGGGHGRVALADGTAFNTLNLSAYESGSGGGRRPSSGSSSSIHKTSSSSKKKSSGSSKTSGTKSSYKGSSSNNDAEKEFEEEFDLIAIAVDRASEAIDRLKVIADSAFKTLTTRNSALVSEISAVANKINVENRAYESYMAKANSLGLDETWARKIREGSFEISTVTDEDLADKIKDYQDFYEKAIEAKDAVADLHKEIANLYKDRFDNLSNDFENQLSLLEHLTNTYDNGIDNLEERGYLASTKFYEAMQNVEKQNIDIQKKELDSLVKSMSEAVNSGEIKEGSEAWYDMQNDINSVKESIQESETALVKFQNSIRETKWDRFDYLQEQISNITDEANFMIDLMENSNLYTDNGKFTDTGMATLGLRGQNYNVYMAQADKYAEELKKLNAEIANDPNNTKLLEHRQDLLEAQRDAILAAEDEKQAIKDLVADGIEKELDALQDLIDKYTDAIDTAKDLHDYQKDIEKQSSEIAKLQKQLLAYSGDNSEETKATIQKIQVDLADAMDDLEETQYEHYISEQKKLLDNLYDEYEAILNERLDNIDALMADMIATINSNSANISTTLQTQSEKVGYDLSAAMRSIWSNEGSGYSIITKYGESFLTQLTSVNDVITKIAYKIGAMVKESDKTADSTINSATPSTKTDPSAKPPAPSAPASTPANNAPKFTEDVKRGVAAAIWIYGSKSGWGNSPDRKGRLTSKFGAANAAAVQSYINAHANNGDLYRYWVSTGKSKLSQYYYSAFKKGGLADYTGVAWLDGSPTEPEMVLNPEDTKNFIALKDAMRSIADGSNPISALFGDDGTTNVLSQIAKMSTPVSGKDTTNIGDITYQVTIPIDHVQDYNDFMNQMRKDGKFEKMIRSMTVDQLSGGSKLSKNKYQW